MDILRLQLLGIGKDEESTGVTQIYNGDFAIATDNGVSLISDTGWSYTVGSATFIWEDNRGGYTCINTRNANTSYLDQETGYKITWEDGATYRLNWQVADNTGDLDALEVYAGNSYMFRLGGSGAQSQEFTVGVGEVDGIRFKGVGGTWSYFTNFVLTKL